MAMIRPKENLERLQPQFLKIRVLRFQVLKARKKK
jgi:hypothetical protein